MFRKAGIGFAALAMLAPGLAAALGVGEYQLSSYLNQPLKMTVELTDTGDLAAEEILVTLASQKDFDSAGVDRVFFLSDLEFEVELQGDGTGLLTIYSDQPVREPFLDFLVEVLWPQGRILREYTVLLDPPTYAEEVGSEVGVPQSSDAAAAPVQPAPAPAPVASSATQPAAAAPAAAPVTSTGYAGPREEYVVQSQDTMWRIALNTRPSNSISVQQMMLSIQELNPDAFIDGNVNLVREGTVLRLPTEDEVRGISTRTALSEVADQNRRWRDKLAAMGIAVPTRAQVGTGAASGQTGGLPDADEGKVTLVSPEASAGGSEGGSGTGGEGTAALENEIAIREENLDQLRRDNDELSSRLQDLQGQVETSEKLLQLRNDQIAKLQAQLRQLEEAKGIEPSEPLVSDQELAAETEAAAQGAAAEGPSAAAAEQGAAAGEQPAGAAGAGQVADAGAGAESAQSGEAATPGAGAAPAQEPLEVDLNAVKNYGQISAKPTGDPDLDPLLQSETGGELPPELAAVMESSGQGGGMQIQLKGGAAPAPAAQPEPAAEQSGGIMQLVMDNLVALVGGLVGLLVLVFALIFMRNRQKKQAEEQTVAADMEAADEDFFVDNIDDDEVEGTFAGDEPAEQDDTGSAPSQDPLEQVDVYIAYGRHAEAVSLLRHETGMAPERADLKVRLLEVLAEMQDRNGFEQDAAKFAGDPQVDARVSELRASMEGGAAMDDGPSLDDLEMDLGGGDAAADGDDLDMDLSLDDAGDDQDGDATLVLDAAGDGAEDDDLGDFDLDLGGAGDADGGDELDLDLGADSPAEEDELGLDLDLASDSAAPAPAEEELDLDLGMDSEPSADSDDLGGLEFSLDDDTGAASDEGDLELSLDDEPEAEAAADSETDFGMDLDLDADGGLDLGGDSAGEEDIALDLDDVSLDDASDEFQEAAEKPAEEELDLSLDDLGLDDEPAAAAEEPTEAGMPAVDDLSLDGEELGGATEQRDAFSLDDADSAEPAAATDMREAVDVSGGGDEDDFDFLGDTDENATKLDLAKAYIDMGDSEGARDILNEVVAEGNDAQQQEAKELLAQVG